MSEINKGLEAELGAFAGGSKNTKSISFHILFFLFLGILMVTLLLHLTIISFDYIQYYMPLVSMLLKMLKMCFLF